MIGIAFGLGVLGALGVGCTYLFFGGILGEYLFHTPALTTATGLVAGWMALITLQMLLAETFRGFHDIRLASIFSGLASGGLAANILLTICLGLLWWVNGQAALPTVLLLTVGCLSISVMMGSWILRHRMMSLPSGGAQTRTGYGDVLRMAWPNLITNLTILALELGMIDIWILGAVRPEEDVALYGAAARAVILLPLPLSIVNAVVAPLIAEMYAQGKKRELERTLRATATLAGIPAFFVLVAFILLGRPVLGLVFGDYYQGAATVLILLSIGQFVNVWVGSCLLTLVMTGHQTAMMKIALISSLITLIPGLEAAKHYGAPGMATAASLGLMIQSILMWLTVRRKTAIWTHVSFTELFSLVRELKHPNVKSDDN
jgi:O-antigen/teichoic acid export membrane protein